MNNEPLTRGPEIEPLFDSAAWAIHYEWCKASENRAPCYGPTDADRERARREAESSE